MTKICFNCKAETDDNYIIDLFAKFSPVWSVIGDTKVAKDTTEYHNVLCTECSMFIAKLLSDNVRPPEERGIPYQLVIAKEGK